METNGVAQTAAVLVGEADARHKSTNLNRKLRAPVIMGVNTDPES